MWLPPGVWLRCFGILPRLRGRLPVGGPFGPPALQCPPIGQSVPSAHQKGPSGAVCGPCGAWGYAVPHPAPVGGLLGPILALPGIFDPAAMHARTESPVSSLPPARPGSLLGAARVRAVSFRGLSPFPGSVLRAGSDLRRDAPQIRPAPASKTPVNAFSGSFLPPFIPGPAGDFHFWPNLSPAPRPSALAFSWVLHPGPLGIVRRAWRSSHPGGNFYAWHSGAPPVPPFLPPPRSGGGQGGLVVLGNKSGSLVSW